MRMMTGALRQLGELEEELEKPENFGTRGMQDLFSSTLLAG